MKKKTWLTISCVTLVVLLFVFLWMLSHPENADAKPEIQEQPKAVTYLGEPKKEPAYIPVVSEETLADRLKKAGLNGGYAAFDPKAEDLPAEEN